MSILRPVVRRTKAFGAQLPAIVEEVNLGLATVRLAPNGARLTNLPTMGDIAPGDNVIVDYATGEPYVRPTTVVEEEEIILEESLAVPEDEEVPVQTGNPAICTCKIKGGTQASWEWVWNYSQEQYVRGRRDIIFNQVIFDPNRLHNGQDITIKESGMYLWGAECTFSTSGCGNAWSQISLIPNVERKGGERYIIGPWKIIRGGSSPAICTISGIYLFYSGEKIKIYTDSCGDVIYDPILTVWKISDLRGLSRKPGS